MKKIISCFSFFTFLSVATLAQHPQKFDSFYKTIYAKDFCRLMQQNPGIVLIDVRTAGEYSDTSQYNSLNMGHLKGAINIGIDSMKKDTGFIRRYHDKTLVLYCSHSQRSRRVSKYLTDNGFTGFYNLNGGMSHLNQMAADEFPCKNDWIVSGLGYKNISNADAVNMIKSKPDLVVLDVRPAIQFISKDTLEKNNAGKLKGAINIPYAEIKQRIGELDKHKNSSILVYAATGDGDAARASAELISKGFTRVYHLLGGLNDLIATQSDCSFLETAMPFRILDSRRVLALLKSEPMLVIYDARPKSEFENRDTLSWKNLGRIKDAINVNRVDFDHVELPANKNTSILVYGQADAYELATILAGKGYKKVYLMDGLYDFFWSSFNVEDCKEANSFLVNHEGIY